MNTILEKLSIEGIPTLTLLIIAVLFMMPIIVAKRDVFFGVTVAPGTDQTLEGRAIMTFWRFTIGISSTILIALNIFAIVLLPPEIAVIISVVSIFVFLGAVIFGIIISHQRAQALAIPGSGMVRSALVQQEPHKNIPLWWEIVPILIIAATAAILAGTYASAPAMIAIHFNINNQPDSYAAKSIGSYFLIVWMQLFLWVLLTTLRIVFLNVRVARVEGSNEFPATMAKFIYSIEVLVLIGLGLLQIILYTTGAKSGIPAKIMILLLPGIFVLVAIFMRRYATILNERSNSDDATDDRYWIGGIVYHNPADPALFVERRFGVGYTLNVGNPWSWLIIIGILALLIGLPAMTRLLAH